MIKLDHKRMGLEIKVHRIRKGITQRELADMLGISQSHLCNVENGRLSLSLKLLLTLRNIFECSLDELVVEDTPDEKHTEHE
ncbi:helix-turn-helix transcriptional regulator [Phascolarctobacterium sp.]|uniref:helix-turn-helix transcriptional regulator n=1 Tax=Phascolarctobacterium sp. TaxID=2049039 RepID=UPI0015AA2A61|nr:helix-turn-helix transcriptional regulator [uncultured Phascolarctobacterium sp.]